MVRIAVDAMGGDHAPANVVEGVLLAADRFNDQELILVGRETAIREELDRQGANSSHFEIVNADDVIEMDDSPVEALRRKPNSSIRRMVSLQKEGACDAIFSAGNTGAMVAASQMLLGLLPGIRRAGIAVTLPRGRGKSPVVLCDVGANVQCKPQHLFQYGLMAEQLCRRLYDVDAPKVGILNVGAEEQKGTTLVKETSALCREGLASFVGNVEGGEIFQGQADAVICDGFVGNILLKVSEGLSEFLLRSLAGAFRAGIPTDHPLSGELKSVFQDAATQFDYAEYGGAVLLGVDGVAIIGHGRSDGRAIANAVGWAKKMVDTKINDCIVSALDSDRA